MDIASILYAKKKFGGGGGGSSDFSTAEVTLKNECDGVITVYAPILIEDDGEIVWVVEKNIFPDSEITAQVVLYHSESPQIVVTLDGGDAPEGVVTGDIIEEDGVYFISGNGTITWSTMT